MAQATLALQPLKSHLHFAISTLMLVANFGAWATGGEPDERSVMRLPAEDPRVAVSISGEDRAYVLGQMRLFLANIQRTTLALSKNDLELAGKVAAIAGAKNNEVDPSRPATLRARQPAAWNQYIGQVRKDFDDLASTAATAPVTVSLEKLSAVTQNCVVCHQTFRIVD